MACFRYSSTKVRHDNKILMKHLQNDTHFEQLFSLLIQNIK